MSRKTSFELSAFNFQNYGIKQNVTLIDKKK